MGWRHTHTLAGMDQTTVLLIAAAIGAGGAVITQVVAAYFAGVRDKRRLMWEQEQAEERLTWERQQSERSFELQRLGTFLDVKRHAYVRFVQMSISRRDAITDYIYGESEQRTSARALLRGDESLRWWRDYSELVAEIVILERSVGQPCRAVFELLADWEEIVREGDKSGAEVLSERFDEALTTLTAAIRQSLGITETVDIGDAE